MKGRMNENSSSGVRNETKKTKEGTQRKNKLINKEKRKVKK